MPGLLDFLRSKIAPTTAAATPPPNQDEAMMNELMARVRKEMPDVADTPIAPMGPIGKLMSKGALAVTSPFGNVSYNADALRDSSPDENADTLVHELTHARQIKAMSPLDKVGALLKGVQYGFGGGLPYGQRPEELEAYQAEADRAMSQGRTPAPKPSFLTPGDFQSKGDIILYPDHRRRPK